MHLGGAGVCNGLAGMTDDIDCYWPLEFEDFTLAMKRSLLYSCFARTVVALTTNAVRVLRTCGSLIAPLEADVEQCAKSGSFLKRSAAGPPTSFALWRRSVYWSLSAWLPTEFVESAPKTEAVAPLRTVGIITRHRRDLLDRGLSALRRAAIAAKKKSERVARLSRGADPHVRRGASQTRRWSRRRRWRTAGHTHESPSWVFKRLRTSAPSLARHCDDRTEHFSRRYDRLDPIFVDTF